MTRDVPFTVSPSAEVYLRELLRHGAETLPEFVPVLSWHKALLTRWNFTAWFDSEDSEGDYSVGYFSPEDVGDWPRVRVAGAELAINPETFEKMRGLHLMLEGATEGKPLSGRVVGRRY